MKWFVLLLALVSCGAKPLEVKITAAKSSTVTLAKTGKLSVRLEIRRLGSETNAVALMSWAGSDSSSVDAQIALYKLSSKLLPLRSNADSMEFDSGQTRITGTQTILESGRTCATLTLAVLGFNANADELLENSVIDACEKP
jgi:UV DNA damage repair endonuclease